MTLALLLFLGEEVGHKVIVVTVLVLGDLIYWQDSLYAALFLLNVNFFHTKNKFNNDTDLNQRHSILPRQLRSQLGKVD